jgi:hypothetical protein
VTASDGINVSMDCGVADGRVSCDTTPPGFGWSDTLLSHSVRDVTITFQHAIDCEGGLRTASLNGGAAVTYANSYRCQCDPPANNPKTLTFPAADYNLGTFNTFLATNPTSCVGFSNLQSGNGVGNWAEVCVFTSEFVLVLFCDVPLRCVAIT